MDFIFTITEFKSHATSIRHRPTSYLKNKFSARLTDDLEQHQNTDLYIKIVSATVNVSMESNFYQICCQDSQLKTKIGLTN